MQIIFQDPYSSLNPRLTIQDTIMEPLKLSGRFKADALAKEADRLIREGFDEDYFQRALRSSFGSSLRGLNSFENIAVSLTEGCFGGFDPFRFPQIFDAVTQEDILNFLRDNMTADRAVLSEIVPKEA
jgi:predicted Zn-dependent peptidase